MERIKRVIVEREHDEGKGQCPSCKKAPMEVASLKLHRVKNIRLGARAKLSVIDPIYVNVLVCPECKHLEFLEEEVSEK